MGSLNREGFRNSLKDRKIRILSCCSQKMLWLRKYPHMFDDPHHTDLKIHHFFFTLPLSKPTEYQLGVSESSFG